jgi:hypothetical protein
MKNFLKTPLLVFLLVLSASSLRAQERLPFLLIPKAGANVSWSTYSINDVFLPGLGVVRFSEESDVQFGFQVGFSAYVPLGRHLYLVSGLEFQERGYQDLLASGPINVEFVKFRFRYLQVPIKFAYSSILENDFIVNFQGGVVLSQVVGQSHQIKGSSNRWESYDSFSGSD